LANADFEFEPAAVNFEFGIAAGQHAVDRRTREAGEKIA
jgi:hypothetical protein